MSLSVFYQPKFSNQCYNSTEPQSPSKRDRETKLNTFLRTKEQRGDKPSSLPHSLVLGCTEDSVGGGRVERGYRWCSRSPYSAAPPGCL